MLCHRWSINSQRNLSRCRPRNYPWKLNDSWRMEPTSWMNSRPTHQIDSKNRVMADAWSCQKCYVTADPLIVSKNRVIVELEIITENWVTGDVWNPQRPWIHDRRIKSIAKRESWLMNRIVKNAMSNLIHKSSMKTKSCRPWNRHSKLNDSWRVESTASMNSRPMHQIDSKIRVMADTWNCHKNYVITDP